MNEFSVPTRVYIEDTDAGGIVYYVNYLKFMERARTELLRSLGFGKAATLENNLLLVVASAQVDYKKSARLDDVLQVTAAFERVARSYVVFNQKVLREQECLCSGTIKVACVQRDTMRPTPMPAAFAEAIKNTFGGTA